MKLSLLLLAAAVAAPVFAADKPLYLTGGPKAEDALRLFVENDPTVKARLDEAGRREESLLAAGRDPDLRDAVSDGNGPDQLKSALARASASERVELLQRLPGLKASGAPTCRALSDCADLDLSAQVADASLLPDALRRLVRPWMLLQQARGSEVVLSSVGGAGDAAIRVGLEGLDAEPLTLNVTPNQGGFKVWFDRPQEIASLYAQEREAALKPAP